MTAVAEHVVLALGSNLGDRGALLEEARARIAVLPGVDVTAASPVLETVAVTLDGEDESKPRYLNQVLLADVTGAEPIELLHLLLDIERELGRVRHERWGDRTVDIDVIAFGDRVSDAPELTLPHPRAHERAFVLGPWAAVDPDAALPGRGRVTDLLASVESQQDEEGAGA